MRTITSHPGAGWRIRAYTHGDLRGVLRVFRQCLQAFPWRGSFGRERAELVRGSVGRSIFVAEEPQAGIVGFLVVDLAEGYVPYLFVDLDWRFCGIGKAFLAIARDQARRPLMLDVDEPNMAARAAYKALGWRETAEARANRAGVRQIRLVGPD